MFFFFFKQKTAYEMRISDWSSDVCSSDLDMWRGPTGQIEYLVNVMWPISPFKAENGATLIWPGSHNAGSTQDAQPVAVEAEPGSAILFLGSTLHGAGANMTGAIRRGIIVSYCLGWLKPYENQRLT